MFEISKIMVGVLGLLVGAGGGYVFLMFLQKSQTRVRFDLLFAANLLGFFGAGCCYPAFVVDGFSWTRILQKNDINIPDVYIGMATLVVFASTIIFLGGVVKKSFYPSTERLRNACLYVARPWWVGFVLLLLSIGILVAVSQGKAGLLTVDIDDVSALALVINPLVTALLPICILRAVLAPNPLSIVGLLAQCAASIWFGRWAFILMFVNGVLLLIVSGIPRRKLIWVGAAAAVMMPIGFIFIFAIRMGIWSAADPKAIDIVQVVKDAVYIAVTGGEGKQSMSSDLKVNANERPFYHVGYLALVARYGLYAPVGASGELLVYSMLGAVPSAISDAKAEFLDGGEEEGLTMRTFHIRTSDDEANTIVTGALTDFGVFGLVIYPFIIIALLMVFVWLTKKNPDPLCYLMGMVATSHFLLQTETTLTGWFLTTRFLITLLVCGIGSALLRQLVSTRRTRDMRRAEPALMPH